MTKNITASSNVIPFDFDERPVRALLINDQPWFAAKDIINALEYSKSSSPAKLLDHVPAQWKGVNPIHTPGGIQRLLMLSEQGLYFFLGRSDKPKALPFQMWLAGEVLPSIRQHGRYVDEAGQLGTLLNTTIGTDGFRCLAAVVEGKARALPAPMRRQAKAKLWAQVHAAFSVRRGEDIPADQLDAARNFVAAYALEGEWLPKAEEGDFIIKRDDAHAICHLLHHAEWCVYRWNSGISAGLRELNRPLWSGAVEHFRQVELTGKSLELRMADLIDHFRSRHGGLRPDEFFARRVAA